MVRSLADRTFQLRLELSLEHKQAVNGLEFSADELSLATASADQLARLWSTDSGHAIVMLKDNFTLYDVAMGSDGTIAVSGDCRCVRLWSPP